MIFQAMCRRSCEDAAFASRRNNWVRKVRRRKLHVNESFIRASPEDVRLILVDPKMLELSVYDGIPHLLTPVITDMKDAANGLRWCVAEMERRYKLMASLLGLEISGYNKKISDANNKGSAYQTLCGTQMIILYRKVVLTPKLEELPAS